MIESFWLKQAFARENELSPPLDGDTRADVCIVGGGYTGLWTALRLKQADPSLDVVLIEAKRCGSGGSGANAGFVAPYWAHFATFKHLAGTDEAVRLCHAAAQVGHEIEALMAEHDVDVQLKRNGTIWGATCEHQLGAWDEAVDALEKQQLHPYLPVDAAEIEARTGVNGYLGGVLEADNVTLQPALLVRALRRIAIERGVRLHEYTPMTRLQRTRPPKVETTGGND